MSPSNSVLNKDIQKMVKMLEIVGSDFENSSEEIITKPTSVNGFFTSFIVCFN